MGVQLAAQRIVPVARQGGSDETRTARLHAVTEVLRLFQDLERALDVTADGELARLITASRAGERALGRWAVRLDALRSMKRRVESGIIEPLGWTGTQAGPPRSGWTLRAPTTLPFAWEAAAFLVGFVVSLFCWT